MYRIDRTTASRGRSSRIRTRLAAAAGAAALSSLAIDPATAQVAVGAPPITNNDVTSWGAGSGGQPTWGEVVQAPTGVSTLKDFTVYAGYVFSTNFYTGVTTGGGPANFRAYVYAWNGGAPTGPALFQSNELSTSPAVGQAGYGPDAFFWPLTVDTGGVAVMPGRDYVIFLSTNDLTQQLSSPSFSWAGAASYPQADNVMVTSNGAGVDFTTQTWNPVNRNVFKLAFNADFASASVSVVPEPATWAMLILGLAMVGFAARRGREDMRIAA